MTITTLGDVCQVITKGTTPTSYGLEYTQSGVPFIRVNDFPDGKLVLTTQTLHVAESTSDRYSRSIIKSGDVLLSIAGTIGRSCVVPSGTPAMNCNQAVCVIRPNTQVLDAQFLNYWLKSDSAKGQLTQGKVTGVISNFNLTLVRQLQIPLPSLPEQKRIAAILDQAEALRAKRRAAIKLLDELTQSIFLDMFGDPVTNPKGWPISSLNKLFNFTTGRLDSNASIAGGKFPFFTCAREDYYIDEYAFDCEALLLAGNNANADYSVKHYQGKFNAYQRTYVITLKNPSNSFVYARFALQSKLAELKRVSKGTNTKYLTLQLLHQIEVAEPPIALQKEFAQRVLDLDLCAQSFRRSLLALDNLFASLQHRAFRGQL